MSNTINIAPFGEQIPVGANSGYPTILVKFLFTNAAHIPAGIPEQVRADHAAMDRKHTQEAYQGGYGHLANEGRIREGRVDTGTNFIKNLQLIQAGFLTRGLSNIGYQFTTCHWFYRKGYGESSDKYVVVLGYTNDMACKPEQEKDFVAQPALDLPNKAIEQRRALASTCWQYCHGWANLDGVISFNIGGRLPDGRAQHAIVVRNRAVTAARITRLVTEENE